MSGKIVNFNDKKIKKCYFYKNKKVFQIDNINVNNILVSKKETYGTRIHFNTLLDILIMMLLDHYL